MKKNVTSSQNTNIISLAIKDLLLNQPKSVFVVNKCRDDIVEVVGVYKKEETARLEFLKRIMLEYRLSFAFINKIDDMENIDLSEIIIDQNNEYFQVNINLVLKKFEDNAKVYLETLKRLNDEIEEFYWERTQSGRNYLYFIEEVQFNTQ